MTTLTSQRELEAELLRVPRPLGVAPEAHPYGLPESLTFFQQLRVTGFAAALRQAAEKDRQTRDEQAQAAMRSAAAARGEALRVCALTLAYLEGA